jgi:hypothetical protein
VQIAEASAATLRTLLARARGSDCIDKPVSVPTLDAGKHSGETKPWPGRKGSGSYCGLAADRSSNGYASSGGAASERQLGTPSGSEGVLSSVKNRNGKIKAA